MAYWRILLVCFLIQSVILALHLLILLHGFCFLLYFILYDSVLFLLSAHLAQHFPPPWNSYNPHCNLWDENSYLQWQIRKPRSREALPGLRMRMWLWLQNQVFFSKPGSWLFSSIHCLPRNLALTRNFVLFLSCFLISSLSPEDIMVSFYM